ncbi:MAG: MFS transporter [Candidatus Dormibacteria bacterium]
MSQQVASSPAPSYRSLLRVTGFKPLLATALLARTALMMSTVAFVLFALQRFHSPAIAGLTVFLLVFPGMAMSPINGALLDRFGRARMMAVDLSLTAAAVLAIAVLAWSGALTAAEMLLIVSLASLTGSLSSGATRALFPLVVPEPLWERANAIDMIGYAGGAIVGPALAGGLTATVGGPGALLAIAIAYVAAALPLLVVPDPTVQRPASRGVFRDARDGLAYVVRSRSLRWLAVSLFLVNAGWGIVTVALPLAVFARGSGPGVVGAIFAVEGIVAVPAAILGGRLNTRGRERIIISLCAAAMGAATLLLLAPSLAPLFLGLAVIGAANGPMNVALAALRQRRTAPAWFGRVFAISISLNYAGMPVGAAIAGTVAARSMTAALLVAAGLALVGAIVVWNIPAAEAAVGMPPADDAGVALGDGAPRGQSVAVARAGTARLRT